MNNYNRLISGMARSIIAQMNDWFHLSTGRTVTNRLGTTLSLTSRAVSIHDFFARLILNIKVICHLWPVALSFAVVST